MRRRVGVWATALFGLSLGLFLGGTRPAAAQANSAKIVGGPYAVNVGPRSATVVWLVQTGEGAVGTEPGKMDKAVPILHAESITLTGLKPGATYYYQSFAGDAGKGQFKTPPAGPAQFQFVVYGDTRTRHDVH